MAAREKQFDYDVEKKRIEDLIDIFQRDLEASGLSDKTIKNHVFNAELFLIDYCLDREESTIEDSVAHYGMFISYFYIRKCLWSTPASVKSTTASIKKFYKSMVAHGYMSQDDYDDFKEEVKWNLEDWVEECRAYNDPDSSFDFF